MTLSKHIINIALVVAIIIAGLPFYRSEDASRDQVIDLKDAVLLVKDFSQTAEHPEAFSASMEKVISTLNIVSGLKTDIQPNDHAKSSSKLFHFDFAYLITSHEYFTKLNEYTIVPGPPDTFRSITLRVNTPPPRFV